MFIILYTYQIYEVCGMCCSSARGGHYINETVICFYLLTGISLIIISADSFMFHSDVFVYICYSNENKKTKMPGKMSDQTISLLIYAEY